MKTTYRIPAPYAQQFLKLADSFACESPARPERFMEKMKRNRGAVAGFTQKGLDENGLERKNPVIVALGDSVTAGHFETLLPKDPEALLSNGVNHPSVEGHEVYARVLMKLFED